MGSVSIRQKTLFVVATKSGGTIETISLMKYFYGLACKAMGRERAGARFAAITDPGSGLEATARQLNFRKIFLNDPDIGGRYSALSYFGLVPAGLIGMDLEKMLARAQATGLQCPGRQLPCNGKQHCRMARCRHGRIGRCRPGQADPGAAPLP